MIKHHPTFSMLSAHVAGDLPASLSAGIAIHADFCPKCQQHIDELTEQHAEACFEQSSFENINELACDFDQMIDDICLDDSVVSYHAHTERNIAMRAQQYTLPRALQQVDIAAPANIGKLSRARINLDEGDIRTSLLHIEPQGSVPMHTHQGYELTVLLAGSFKDDMDEYVPGDFIMLDASHEHHPVSENGCLCYTVANAPQRFTQGINKLLNPIGSFIY